MAHLEVLNEFKHASFKGDGTGTRVRLSITGKYSRKVRRAMSSRRWEKKLCKAISAEAGFKLLGIRKAVIK